MLRTFLASFFLFTLTAAAAEPALRDRIATLVQEHHWAAAQPLLEKAVAAEPADAAAHFYLGLALLNQDQAENSITTLEKAVALAPANSEYARTLGDAYGATAQRAGLFSKLGWAKKCKAAYEKAVALDPKNLSARFSLMGYCREAPGIAGGGMDQAYGQAAEIKKLDPAQGRRAYASLYVSEKKFSEAFALYEDALKDAPDDYEALYALGRIAAITGEHLDQGMEVLRKSLSLTPPAGQPGHAPAHWRLGNILEKKGDKPAARAAYEVALKIDPDFKEARASLKKLE